MLIVVGHIVKMCSIVLSSRSWTSPGFAESRKKSVIHFDEGGSNGEKAARTVGIAEQVVPDPASAAAQIASPTEKAVVSEPEDLPWSTGGDRAAPQDDRGP